MERETDKGKWSERAAIQTLLCLAPSQPKLYNFYILDVFLFCKNHEFSFPPSNSVALAASLKLKTLCCFKLLL